MSKRPHTQTGGWKKKQEAEKKKRAEAANHPSQRKLTFSSVIARPQGKRKISSDSRFVKSRENI